MAVVMNVRVTPKRDIDRACWDVRFVPDFSDPLQMRNRHGLTVVLMYLRYLGAFQSTRILRDHQRNLP